MGRRKAGMCKCGHELRRFHDDAGVCIYGAGGPFAGGCARDYGGPCSKPRRKKMNGTTKATTRTITVDGDKVLDALDNIIIGLQVIRAEVARAKKTEGAPTIPRLLADAPAPSSRAEVPARAAPSRGDGEPTPFGAVVFGAGAAAVLTAIAQGYVTTEQLMVATGYSERSVQTYLAELSSGSMITRSAGVATLTDYGTHIADPVPARPTKLALYNERRAEMGQGAQVVLDAIAQIDGEATTAALVEATDYSERSVQTYLAELSKRRLIHRANGRATLHREIGGKA